MSQATAMRTAIMHTLILMLRILITGSRKIMKKYNKSKNFKTCSFRLSQRVLTVRFATSLISPSQAMTNLLAEVGLDAITDFDALVEQSRLQWREVLSRVAVTPIRPLEMGYSAVEADSLLRIFYSSLYRASIFPRQLTEYDAGKEELKHLNVFCNES